VGLAKRASWDDVEALVRQLMALEGIGNVSPSAYARRCVEERLAELHGQRHLAEAARAMPSGRRRFRRVA
jgi:hypothetical protein